MYLIILTIVIERIVHVDAHTFNRSQLHRDRVPKVIFVGLPVTAVFKNGREVGKVALSGPISVRVFHRHDRTRITSHKIIAMHVILIQSSQLGAVEACFHGEVQPFVYVIVDVVHHIELLELFVTETN